jgi:cysteinyl-tRNA synthetase
MIKFYNTLSRKLEEFKPIEPGKVKMYSCGPTVYSKQHIGNIFAYICWDILKRTLKFSGYEVKHVMNITDVGHLTDDGDFGEDKMEKGSRLEGLSAWEIAEKYTKQFFNDCGQLNIIKPDIVGRVTDHIQEQIKIIKDLEQKGYTYITSDGVYFDTTKLKDYGKLARLDIEGLSEAARVEMGDKKNKTDFALWKFSPKDEKRQMEWESPWGIGFPGWHIECSAIGLKYLGEYIDIHTGGIDHIPVHHTNEIAQNECYTGHKTVNYWLHNNHILVDGGKMSKSLGNVYYIDTIIEKGCHPLSYRYLTLTSNYRSQLNFTFKSLEGANQSLLNIYQQIQQLKQNAPRGTFEEQNLSENGKKYIENFKSAIYNDLNTAISLTVLRDVLNDQILTPEEKLFLIEKFDIIFGLDLNLTRDDTKKLLIENTYQKISYDNLTPEIKNLIDRRQEAKSAKNYQKSDEIRKTLLQKGYIIEDTKSGIIIKKKANK